MCAGFICMEKGWTLTVCLIVKNEEHCLGRCLDSIKDWADQIVIVDTGSTDNTLQVARQYKAQIEYFSWKDDFAQARNYSLQFAVSDWILVLDADEYIEGNLESLSDLAVQEYEGYYLTIQSLLGADGVAAEDHVVRLFRNRRGYEFHGAIHEQIAGSIKAGKGEEAIGFAGIVVNHSGYMSEEIARKQKMERNSRIIRSELAKYQTDTFMLYSLGTELMQQEQYGEACDVLDKALRHMTGGEGYFREVLLLALMACLKNRAYGEREDLFAKALIMLPADTDILFLAGLRQGFLGNYRSAGELFVGGGIHSLLAPANLIYAITGELFFRQQSWCEAARYFKLSLEAGPSLYSAVRMIEITRQGQAGNGKDALDMETGINLKQWKTLYQTSIKQADSIPAVIKDYLGILCQQIEVCTIVLAADKKCRIAQRYLAKAVNKSLKVWLTLWPEHVMPINIWECCI